MGDPMENRKGKFREVSTVNQMYSPTINTFGILKLYETKKGGDWSRVEIRGWM